MLLMNFISLSFPLSYFPLFLNLLLFHYTNVCTNLDVILCLFSRINAFIRISLLFLRHAHFIGHTIKETSVLVLLSSLRCLARFHRDTEELRLLQDPWEAARRFRGLRFQFVTRLSKRGKPFSPKESTIH